MDPVKIIRRFRTPILVALALAVAAYVLVVGFGDALGVDPAFKAQVSHAAAWTWAAAVSLLAPLGTRDDNGNGVPDVLEPPSVSPPPMPEADR